MLVGSENFNTSTTELDFEFCAIFYVFQTKICFYKVNESFWRAMQQFGWNHAHYSFNNLLVSSRTQVIFVKSSGMPVALNKEKELSFVSLFSTLLMGNNKLIKAPNYTVLKKVRIEIKYQILVF